MQYVRIELWPAGVVLAVAVVLMAAMRALEGYAHRIAGKRTRRALQHARASTEE